ncbi:general secretion pathway protein GspJ [Bdellovibrio bacteriovorus]|uniref:Type II secretion system protein J n=1 Tax=Bdellovibrio bacteriovorus TaxID=959 RepID=A0A150WM66_BDEBC|nr:type II secretion system protein GspJ [Bdellovibrio bacteriovorus]KYG64887.1 general secretion pathway protein GspJ [Bdellovibrio bacteriovorus]
MVKNKNGFTLIELMIALAILATLTVLTSQAISQAVKAKIKLQDQLDDVSRMRDAVRLIEKDLNLAYHYRDVEKEIQDLINKANAPPQIPGAPPQQPPVQPQTATRREVPRRDPETHFIGTTDSVNFVTMNNARAVRNTQAADFIEVGYSLRECRNLRSDTSSKCIWRRSTPFVDLDVTKGGDEVVLMENVTEFKLRYIGKGKQDWVTDWRTDAQGDASTKGKFPQAVELSVTMDKKVQGRSKKYSMQLIIPIHFPNNPDEGAANGRTQ